MDAIEAARQEAEKLHLAAVNAGNNADNLLAFVLAEARRRNIEVCPVAKNDPQLKGGQATFDSQAWMILYEDSGSEFNRAFLVAHEIGHVALEGETEDVVINFDAERPSEDPAVGVERVNDYGSQERREVIMDLFAREFLLPRSIVKHWHLHEELSSVAISNRLNVPLGVVQQQLLDALLLPSRVPVPQKASKKSYAPDQSQSDAASHRGSPYQLQAGPGTGKTSTLVQRIVGLLNDGVDPSTILVLTYTNKAAGELRERVAEKAPESVATLWVGTFHSFGLDIIHRFHDLLGLSENPSVISSYEAIELLEDELTKLPFKHFQNFYDPTLNLADMLRAISRAKDEVVNASKYRKLAEKMLESACGDEKRCIQAEKCLEVAMLFERYEKLLKEHDAVDFGDLVSLPVSLVEAKEDVRKSLLTRHQHILVDEYQDVNRASVRLLKAISGDGGKLWVVGDARQSIYRFRGASSINMKRFSDDFVGAKIEQLEVNYRSVREVIDLYSAFSTKMEASKGEVPLHLNANRGASSVLPEFRVANSLDDEIATVASAIEEKKGQGFRYEQQAILCVSHKRLGEIAQCLESLGIPVLYLGSLFERSEVKNLLSLLSLVVDRRAIGIVRTATLPNMSLTLEEVATITQYIKTHDLAPLDWVSAIDDIDGMSNNGRDSLRYLASVMHGFSINDNPWKVLATLIIDRLEIAKKIAQSDTIKDQMEGVAIWQFLNFCRKKINGKGVLIERLLFRIRRIVLLSEDRGMRQLPQAAGNINGVRLMTIHASKGLEFDVVHLPGMIATGLPGSNRPPRCLPPDSLIEGTEGLNGSEAVKAGHDEEEECKFFVAASRAKDRLILYASSVQNNGKSRSRSKYIARIVAQIYCVEQPSLLVGKEQLMQSFGLNVDEDLLITDKQLSQYDRCPRRFLYGHGLSLGGKRVESAFMQMHSVVYDVLDWFFQNHSESTPSKAELEAQFQQSWLDKGPVAHGYAEGYQRIGYRFVEFLLETRQGKQLIKPEALKISFPNGELSIMPDEVMVDQHGLHRVRRIKTGKQGSQEFDNIEYSILVEAAEQHFGKGTQVEVVHLAGETQAAVIITDKKKSSRLDKSSRALLAISKGDFPPVSDSRTCPRCPSFFICGDVPQGKIKIKIKIKN